MNDTPRLRLALIASGDPEDVRTWSGTPFHMLQALREVADVTVIRTPWRRPMFKARMALRKLTRGWIDLFWSPTYARIASAPARAELARGDFDAVVAVAITPIAAQLVERYPVIFVSDATLTVMADYYPLFRALASGLKRAARAAETRAISRAALATFPSEWAARSAVADHGGRPDRVVRIEWGANLPPSEGLAAEHRARQWRFLFVGVHWDGKGGPIAVEAVKELRRRGYPAGLDVVGEKPDPLPAGDFVRFHGRIDKTSDDGRARLTELFRNSSLFLFPTRFDALGVVVAEAASFGVPALATRTGGVAGNIVDGRTGLLLTPDADSAAWADAAEALLTDPERYAGMADAAAAHSRGRLNWHAWARSVLSAAESVLSRPWTPAAHDVRDKISNAWHSDAMQTQTLARCIGGPLNLKRTIATADAFSVPNLDDHMDRFAGLERVGDYRRLFGRVFLWRGWR